MASARSLPAVPTLDALRDLVSWARGAGLVHLRIGELEFLLGPVPGTAPEHEASRDLVESDAQRSHDPRKRSSLFDDGADDDDDLFGGGGN